MDGVHDLDILLNSRVALIAIETHEETRVVDMFRRLIVQQGKPLFRWSVTEGVQRLDIDLDPQRHNTQPTEVLRHIKASRTPGIYLLLDFHPYLDDPANVRLLKEIALDYPALGHTLVLISHELDVPGELKYLTARFTPRLPSLPALEDLVREVANEWSAQNQNRRVKTDSETLDLILRQLTGLTEADARRVVRTLIYDDGALTTDDLPALGKAKYELMRQDGVLTLEADTTDFNSVAGLDRIKAWLAQRREVFQGTITRPGLDLPKGILLLGVQGCGKSLAARATAGLWGVPLLRLDFGALYNKFHGETEKNLRTALATAEAMAPCVLWLDEVEKGIAHGDNDGGTSRRVLGTLLTWLADRKSAVFIVATANDIAALPPELIRKGRLDEIFFVDLPSESARREIFAIHLRRRGEDPARYDLAALVQDSTGFSGAEIEQAIVAALYTAHNTREPLSAALVRAELRQTRPLSQVMAEKVAALRAWARDRTVPAD